MAKGGDQVIRGEDAAENACGRFENLTGDAGW